jgi:mannose-6-phosphate isomerase-like protein (cupin superfamily)
MPRRFDVVRRLSLQLHHHRAEHLIVVHGTAMVTIGEDVKRLYENESIYVRAAPVIAWRI